MIVLLKVFVNKIKYILWDHDGVLVDTEKWYFEANRKALNELGIELDLNQYMQFMLMGKSCWDLARRKGKFEDEVQLQKKKRNAYYQEFLVSEDIEIPHVEETLARFSEKYSMAIVTTSKREDFELIHKNRSIKKYMKFVLTLGDYGRAKPAPDPYLAALRRFNADASEAVVIEDSGRGLKSAIEAGIRCIIVRNEFTKSHDFAGAYRVVDSVGDLAGILL